MKLNTFAAVIGTMSFLIAAPVFADDSHHPEKVAGATAVKPTKETVKSMQDNVKKMQRQLDRIGQAKTDDERHKLIAEHMQTMRENMMMAKGMMGDDMGCPMMKDNGGMMDGNKSDGSDEHMHHMMKDDGDKPMPGMDKQ